MKIIYFRVAAAGAAAAASPGSLKEAARQREKNMTFKLKSACLLVHTLSVDEKVQWAVRKKKRSQEQKVQFTHRLRLFEALNFNATRRRNCICTLRTFSF